MGQILSLGCKWLRGRDLNPRPLGYENNLALSLLFQSTIYTALVVRFLPLLARFCGVIVVETPPKVHLNPPKVHSNRMSDPSLTISADLRKACTHGRAWCQKGKA